MTAFVDTNVAFYALDRRHPEKRAIARVILESSPAPSTSPQVLRELYVAARSKLGATSQQAALVVEPLFATVAVVEDEGLLRRAMAAADRWQIHLYDALIVEAARRADAMSCCPRTSSTAWISTASSSRTPSGNDPWRSPLTSN